MITEDMVSVKLPPLQYSVLSALLHNKKEDDKVFPNVVYKNIWQYYKRYGVGPHIARGAFADQQVREIVKAHMAEKPNESPEASLARLKKDIKEKW